MARIFSPARVVVAGLLLLGVAAVLYLVPSDRYIFLPDRARAVAPLVTVRGERDDKDGGGFYYVAVDVRKATLIEKLFPGLRDGSTLVPVSALRAPGESERTRQSGELRAMARSQDVAAAVALRELGYLVTARPNGTLIAAVDPHGPAAGKLQPQEVVVAVDGRPARTPADLRRLIRKHRPGETVRLSVRGSRGIRLVQVKTVPDPRDRSRPLIGVLVDQFAEIKIPLAVKIDVGQVGGPSAGLAFALDLVEELGRDIDHGHKIAATGELSLDGSVQPVGGLKQKTIGAKRAGVDVFIVPAGENTTEARQYSGNLRILPVKSFRQALHDLATLPRTARKT